MICFKDRTFCSSDCVQSRCFRFFGEVQRQEAEDWAASFGWEEAPIAFSDWTNSCPDYKKG